MGVYVDAQDRYVLPSGQTRSPRPMKTHEPSSADLSQICSLPIALPPPNYLPVLRSIPNAPQVPRLAQTMRSLQRLYCLRRRSCFTSMGRRWRVVRCFRRASRCSICVRYSGKGRRTEIISWMSCILPGSCCLVNSSCNASISSCSAISSFASWAWTASIRASEASGYCKPSVKCEGTAHASPWIQSVSPTGRCTVWQVGR